MEPVHRIGVDENGLGARLGPLVVTAVLARVDARGQRTLGRRLPKRIRADLDDSKKLVSHSDFRLGEAWARSFSPTSAHPTALLDSLLLEARDVLSAPCPDHVRAQCWGIEGESFNAELRLCERVQGHHRALADRGIQLVNVKSSVVCTKRLNDARAQGVNRFVADLNAMESLVIAHRKSAGARVHAICGKVGGMGEYSKFFGPLSGHLHSILEEGAARSGYYFPNLGELHFVRDADAEDPLVMLASLIGKYVRELLMARIVRFYPNGESEPASASGYHDAKSASFVKRSALLRRELRVPDACFERARDPDLQGDPDGTPLPV